MSSEVKANKLSPATGTAFTLGDSGDTFTIPSGVTITNSGTATGFGKVLQVVSANKTDTASTTSTSFVSTGLEVSITPSSTSSKILIIANVNLGHDIDNTMGVCILRDSTELNLGDAAGSRMQAGSNIQYQYSSYVTTSFPMNYLDSPSSTSSITYKVAYKCRGYLGNSIYLNRGYTDTDANYYGRSSSTITVMEIEG